MPLSHSLKKIFSPSTTVTNSKNPYANPQNPNHNHNPSLPTTSSQPTTFEPSPRPASPRGSFDFLAEAREAIGRDPITGRQRPPQNDSGVETEGEREETSVYKSSALLKKSGTRYDLFVQEMKERREGGGAREEPMGGYYAPAPKQAMEYYAPATRASGSGQRVTFVGRG